MNNQFDQLAKNMAQSVTRRGALKKFGLGLTGIALASLGLANIAEARSCKGPGERCEDSRQCCLGLLCGNWNANTRGHTFCG
jgi:hypothetical protein